MRNSTGGSIVGDGGCQEWNRLVSEGENIRKPVQEESDMKDNKYLKVVVCVHAPDSTVRYGGGSEDSVIVGDR